jgi:integrase
LSRIQYKDIDLENQAVHITAFETWKKSRDRIVYLGIETMSLLWKAAAENEDPEAWLFPSTCGKNRPLDRNAIDHLLKRLGKKAGIENCGAHRFRHTFAIQYLRNGGDIYTLKRLIGHKSFYMVQRYLQLSEMDAKRAHQKASPVDNWI